MVIYFGLYYLAFRYMFIYVHRQPLDSGGLIFTRIIDQIYISVILFEVVMLGLFVLQEAAGEAVVMFLLLVASLAAIIISRNKVFSPLIQYLPVEAFDARGVAAAMSGNAVSVLDTMDSGALSQSGSGDNADLTKGPLETVNPIPPQEEFHEKAPYKNPSLPLLEPDTKEIYSPDPPKSQTEGDDRRPERQASIASRQSQHSNSAPLPSIRVETVAEPSTSTDLTISPLGSPVTNTPSPRGLLVRRGSDDDGGIGAGSSLQVLGANHSVMSSSDAAAEKLVSDSLSYVNPALWKQCMPIWLPKDPRGFAELETVEMNNAGLSCTTESATMDTKGKIAVETSQRDVAPGEERWESSQTRPVIIPILLS